MYYIFNRVALYSQLTCWVANPHVICLLALFPQKNNILYDFEGCLFCVVYKFNLTGGLTLCLGLRCLLLLLLLDCSRSDPSVHVL